MSNNNNIRNIRTDQGVALEVCSYCDTLVMVPDPDTIAPAGSAEVIQRHRDASCVAGDSYEGTGAGRPQ